MKKVIISSLIIMALLTPMVLAASPNTSTKTTEFKQYNTNAYENINCSGRCQSCSKENCPRRRRPYKASN